MFLGVLFLPWSLCASDILSYSINSTGYFAASSTTTLYSVGLPSIGGSADFQAGFLHVIGSTASGGGGGFGAPRLIPLTGPAPTFRLGEVYAFPNPAKKGKKPTLHAEVGVADTVNLRFYDVAGDLVHETELSGNPLIIDDGQGPQYAYEYPWEGHIPSGTYIYVMRAKKAGHEDLEKISKLAVIR